MSADYLTAREACSRLGIKPETLYAYVSRGLVRSVAGEHGRLRRYLAHDVELLKTRHEARSGHAPVAAAALRWGQPVLDTAITAIDDAGLRYRGTNAIALAGAGTRFEAVASLLWNGTPGLPVPALADVAQLDAVEAVAGVIAKGESRLAALPSIVARLALADGARAGATKSRDVERAWTITSTFALAIGLPGPIARLRRAAKSTSIAQAT
ncbi:MAG TPA: citrate synthase, partial [Polyangiaceae bacterium]